MCCKKEVPKICNPAFKLASKAIFIFFVLRQVKYNVLIKVIPNALEQITAPFFASYMIDSTVQALVKLTACVYVNLPFLTKCFASSGLVTPGTFPVFILYWNPSNTF